MYGKSYLNCSILGDHYGESTLENEKPKSYIDMNNEDLIQMLISIIKIIKFYEHCASSRAKALASERRRTVACVKRSEP